jgi:hypothetical protein
MTSFREMSLPLADAGSALLARASRTAELCPGQVRPVTSPVIDSRGDEG